MVMLQPRLPRLLSSLFPKSALLRGILEGSLKQRNWNCEQRDCHIQVTLDYDIGATQQQLTIVWVFRLQPRLEQSLLVLTITFCRNSQLLVEHGAQGQLCLAHSLAFCSHFHRNSANQGRCFLSVGGDKVILSVGGDKVQGVVGSKWQRRLCSVKKNAGCTTNPKISVDY